MGWCTEGVSGGGMMGGGRHMMFPFLGFLIFAVLAVAVVLFVIWLVRRSGRTKVQVGNTAVVDAPMNIARNRLAAGEITVEEFDRIREKLSDPSTG